MFDGMLTADRRICDTMPNRSALGNLSVTWYTFSATPMAFCQAIRSR
jgi:hypothetical protein